MKFLHSIRTKLTLAYTALVAITLLGFGSTAYLFTRSSLSNSLDLSLQNEIWWVNGFIEPKAKKVRLKRRAILELQELRKIASAQPPDTLQREEAEIDQIWSQIYQHTLMSPRKHFIQILDRNGDLLYGSPNLGSLVLQSNAIPYKSISIATIPGENKSELRLAVMQNDYVKIFVAYPLQDLNEILDQIFSLFGYLSPLALLISVIGGWFLAHNSLKPVDDITRTAQMITAQNLNQRLPARTVDDELGRLTATLNNMIGRLRESFAQIERFSADASHELRTPLTIMRGEIEVALRKKRIPPATRELLESIYDELVRLSSIVESLMTLVKSETGRLVFQFDNVQLDHLVDEITEDTRVLAEKKQIKVQVDRIGSAIVRGDAPRLRQLLLNLVENAVKYTPPMGTVTLSLTCTNGQAMISIKDTGIGISRKDLPKIFDRFYRVKGETSSKMEGSGLGLSIAQWIAEAHHGSIQVKSQLRKGSTFTLIIPLENNAG
ncbi:MAG: ATP-binding protein [bacterium]